MAAAISLAEAPKPSNETQIPQLIAIRPKLESAIERQKQRLADADVELARTFISQTHPAANVDVEKVVQMSKSAQESKARLQEGLQALTTVSETVYAHFEKLKAENPEAVAAALQERLKTLEAALGEKKVAEEGLATEIKNLKSELNKLPKRAVKAEA